MQDLVAQGFDPGLRIGTLEDSSLVAKRLADNRRVLCASPDYLARRGVPVTPADLEQHDCLLMVGAKGAAVGRVFRRDLPSVSARQARALGIPGGKAYLSFNEENLTLLAGAGSLMSS